MPTPVYIPNDVLFDVFKFCNRFDINERFEFVNAQWRGCIVTNEAKHFPKFKINKLWICPLFCSLHYSMVPFEETNIAEIFNECTDNCKSKYSKFISDEWPAQRVPFCIYIQRSSNDITTLKKITLNNYSWNIERQECAHFFWHFKDLCFSEMSIDVLNDRALTLFLIDCPIFKPHGNFFEIRTSTEPWAFMRVVELVKQKITIKIEEKNWIEKSEIGKHLILADVENPLARFILSGRKFCSKLVLEAHQFAALFELIEEYKYAANLQFAIPSVHLFVPSFSWHRRQFVEGTLCQMFHSSQKLSALVHQFGNFNEFSTTAKFTCLVKFKENEEDIIDHYDFQINTNDYYLL